MGKLTDRPPPASGTGESSYRDDADAVSMHTTRGDYEYDNAPELPSYDESVAASGSGQTTTSSPVDRFAPISPPPPISSGWSKSRDCAPIKSAAMGSETSIRMDESLMDAGKLHEYIVNYLRMVPPKPAIRVQGWHWETTRRDNKKTQERATDFDFVFSLERFLSSTSDSEWWQPRIVSNSDKAYRGSFRKTRAPGIKRDIEIGDDNTTPALEQFCHEFADSKAILKAFRVSRSVTGLDTKYLENQVTELIRSTYYLGHIDVTFPVADKNVDIYSPHWINNMRISWVRWIFYLTFLWIFTWPVLFFTTRWWAVYDVEWRVSRVLPSRNGAEPERQSAVVTEELWLLHRANLIRSLVMDRFQGDASSLPTYAHYQGRSRSLPGGVLQTGNRNVDVAVNYVQGGLNILSAITGGSTSSGWGADESN